MTEAINPYQPSCLRPTLRVRYFPLLIRYRGLTVAVQDEQTLAERLHVWAKQRGFQLDRRSGKCWVSSRACRWWSIFAWRVRHVPTRVYCRQDRLGRWHLRLVCRHDWAVALPGDPNRVRSELVLLEQLLSANRASEVAACRSAPLP